MKMKIKRISKSTLSVILAMMMLVSTSLVGMFTSTAATVDDNSVGATISNWTISGYPINEWKTDAKQISGSSGSWTYDRGENASNGNVYFKLISHESDGKDYYYSTSKSDSQVSVSLGNPTPLNYDKKGEMYVVATQRYLTFKIDQEQNSQTNRITVTQSSTSGSGSGTSTDYSLRGKGASINNNELDWVSGYDSKYALSDSDGDGIYTVDAKITAENGTLQFEVFGKSGNTTTTYKASSGTPNMLIYNSNNPFTTASNGDASMFINGEKNSTYTIYLDTNGTGNPKVWATKSSVGEKYTVTFDKTGEGTLTAKAGDTEIASGSTVTSGSNVTFTAKPNTDYKVGGWYSDRTFSNKIDGTSNETTYTATITADTNVYVKFVEDSAPTATTYSLNGDYEQGTWEKSKGTPTFVNNTATITFKDRNRYFRLQDSDGNTYGGSNTNINDYTATYTTTYGNDACFVVEEAGTYTITIVGTTTDSNGKTVPQIKVTKQGADGITLAADSTELTFGEADTSVSTSLTVTATGSADISSVTYTVSSNGATVSNDVASVSSDGTFTATQAGEYTVTATAGAYSATVKIKVNAYNPGTLSGKYFFVSRDESPTNWSNSESTTLKEAYDDGTYYYVNFTADELKAINNRNDITGWFYFGISRSNSFSNLYFQNESEKAYTLSEVDDHDLVSYEKKNRGGKWFYAAFNPSSDKVTGITLKFKYNNASDYIIEVEDNYVPFPTDGIKVYAKNGTACNGGTCNFGKTTVTGLESQYIDDQGKYKIYAAKEGERLTISTKLNDNYLKANFYVHSFCINGSNYPAVKDTTDTTGATYRINAPYVMGSEQIEITPIYYNTTIENNDDYVAVYFDSTALGDHWGNTVSAYSYYQDDSKGHAGCMDGAYPGQPMIRVSDTLYMTYISRCEYTLNGSTLTKTTTPVMGFTASNYYENDEVHKLFLTDDQKKNYQTYDYDDFKFIAEAGYDTVRFESKYCTGTTSNKAGHGTTLKDNLDFYTPASDYQDLVDFDGHKCSILRYCSEENNISNDVNNGRLVENQFLTIISTGNNKDNVGQWSTIWYVYAPDGSKITSGHPSDFVPRLDKEGNLLPDGQQTTAYNAVKNKKINIDGKEISAAYFPAKISYETEMEDGGFRSDGLWLFSNSDSKVKVSTKIIYTDTEKSKVNDAVEWKDDPYKEGTITGTFTGADVSVDGVTSEDVYRNTEVQLSATNGNKYIFYGWAIKDSNGEYVMQNELSALSPYTVSVNTTLYAMYVQPDAGTLTLTNNRYTGAGAGIGTGSYYVSAVLYTKDGTLIKNYGRAEKSLIINDPENFNSTTPKDAYFKVTLHTDPFGDSQFVNFYVPSKEDGTLVPRDAETDTAYDYEFNIPVGVLYGADGKQTTQVINSYSNLKLPTVDLKFTHDLYSHAQKNSYDDPAGDGTGSTEIQITVKNNNNVEIYSSQQSSRSITLLSSYLEQVISAIQADDARLSDYTIYVTLTATPDPNTNFITTYRKDYGTPTDTSPLNVSADKESVWDVTTGTNQAVYSATLDKICTYANGTFKFRQNEINFYSDLDTVKIPYKINYNFTSRLYGEQTYAVNGKISMNSLNLSGDATNDYRLSEAFLTSSTPYETNYMKKLTWNYPEAQQSYTAEGGIVVNVNSTQTDIEVTATIKDGDKTYSVTTNYGEHFKLDGKFITASGSKFSYWEVKNMDDEFVCNNYSYQFNYVGYDDYIVTAVYDSSTSQADNINTTITDVNLSRNQWNVPDNSVTYPTADRIYVDFNLAYEYNGVKFNGDTLDKNVKLGYVIVAQRPDGNSVSALELKNAIPSNTSSASFKVNGTNVINKAIDVRDLDNKNRVAATYGIKNTSANRNLTFTAYSYMIVGSEITLSDEPIEFTIDDIGTK